jgi:molybdate transport system regulatory protein
MNILKGKIDQIETHEHLSLVKIKVGRFTFTTVVIETPHSVDYLKTGGEINILFKETEVLICRKPCPQISLQNRIEGTIEDIVKGKLLSQITLHTEIGGIRSIITTNAVRQLGLEKNIEVIAMIKTNEIMLQHD